MAQEIASQAVYDHHWMLLQYSLHNSVPIRYMMCISVELFVVCCRTIVCFILPKRKCGVCVGGVGGIWMQHILYLQRDTEGVSVISGVCTAGTDSD